MIYDLLCEVAEGLEVVGIGMTAVNRSHLTFARQIALRGDAANEERRHLDACLFGYLLTAFLGLEKSLLQAEDGLMYRCRSIVITSFDVRARQ